MDELNRKTVDDFKKSEKNKLVILLDNVRSMNNVGSIFRTADAFLVEKILLCGITPTPPHRDIQKTALGATETVDWSYESDPLPVIFKYKQDGYKIYAAEQVEGSVMLQNVEISKNEKILLILGNEVEGVQEDLLKLCNMVVEIPQFGSKHSLNVAVSAGILLWHFVSKKF
jgi:tRNA G18 (ribose-2'-O)-methylase SpoU